MLLEQGPEASTSGRSPRASPGTPRPGGPPSRRRRSDRNASSVGTMHEPRLGDVPEVRAPLVSHVHRRAVQGEDALCHHVDRPSWPGSRLDRLGTPNISKTDPRSSGEAAACCSKNCSPSPGVCQILAKSCHSKSTSPMPAASVDPRTHQVGSGADDAHDEPPTPVVAHQVDGSLSGERLELGDRATARTLPSWRRTRLVVGTRSRGAGG